MKRSSNLVLLAAMLGLLARRGTAAPGGTVPRGPAATDARPGQTVELPPMVVEGINGNGPRWRFGTLPGFEILSCCNDETTDLFATRTYLQHELLREILPENLRLRTDVPTTLILFSQDLEESMSAEMLAEMRMIGEQSGHGIANGKFSGLPQLRLADADSTAIYFILPDGREFAPSTSTHSNFGDWILRPSDDFSNLKLSSEYIAHLLTSRSPVLSDWFVVGMVRLYQMTDISRNWVSIAPASWISDRQAQGLMQTPECPRTLLPMSELFAPAFSRSVDDEHSRTYRRVWSDQAALFIRWALDDKDPSRRQALWRFAAGETGGRETEARFMECFGLGFAAMRDRLSDYLPTAVTHPMQWSSNRLPQAPRLELTSASPADIHRIKGEWERREIDFVRRTHPKFVPHYVDEARRTLTRAYESGDRDPRLLASIGLLEQEAGNGAEARRFLESAVQADVVSPQADVELARARLAEALAHPDAAGSRLSAGQRASVLAPLAKARPRQPPQYAGYLILAEVWQHCECDPEPADLKELDEGARFFPDAGAFVLAVATWEVRAGNQAEADELIDLALDRGPDLKTRSQLLALRVRQEAVAPIPSAPRIAAPNRPSSFTESDPDGTVDPWLRSEETLSPDGHHFAFIRRVASTPDRIIVVDLENPESWVSLKVPQLPPPNAGEKAGSARSGSARTTLASTRMAMPVYSARLKWDASNHLLIAVGERAVFTIGSEGGRYRVVGSNHLDVDVMDDPAPKAGPIPVVDRRTGKQVGTRLAGTPPKTLWVDSELSEVQFRLEAKFPGRNVSILEWDAARARFVVEALSSEGRRRTFVFNRGTISCSKSPFARPASEREPLSYFEAAIEVLS